MHQWLQENHAQLHTVHSVSHFKMRTPLFEGKKDRFYEKPDSTQITDDVVL